MRTPPMRSLSWSLLCAASLPVVTPCQAQAEPPSLDACRSLLATIDRAWNTGRADDYLRLFAAEQPLLHDLHSRQVRERLAGPVRLQRKSELQAPRRIGDHLVLPVLYQTTAGASGPLPLREQGLIVARQDGKTLVPVLAVDLPWKACDLDDVFTCPPCNYRIGRADGWLCVPIARERTAAVEGATFLLLGTDIALELSVQIGDEVEPATRTVDDLASQLQRRIPGALPGPVERWQPPGMPADVDGLSAARVAVDLPDGQRTVLHTVALGRLRHLLLLRGARTALLAEAERIAALFATYQLLETDAKVALRAASALAAHTGGELADVDYRNERHHVAAAGPPGWHAIQRCGGGLFQVVWSCPHQTGRMWLSGYAPPAGFEAWTTDLADRWLQELLRRGNRAMRDPAAPVWSAADPHGVRSRSFVLPPAADATAGAPPPSERHLRLWLRGDLLVLADGYTADPDQQQALQRAVASVTSL